MTAHVQLRWLRRILLVKVVVTVVAWALPSLVAPASFLELFSLEMPSDPLFLRLFGALAAALAVGYWYAYKDPIRNSAILKVGVVDNGLATLTVLVLGLRGGVSSWFVWLSAGLTALFCGAFVILTPRER